MKKPGDRELWSKTGSLPANPGELTSLHAYVWAEVGFVGSGGAPPGNFEIFHSRKCDFLYFNGYCIENIKKNPENLINIF